MAGTSPGCLPPGRRVSVTGIRIRRVRHGRLTGHREQLDLPGVPGQLGMLS
jgi:hypothetical protein